MSYSQAIEYLFNSQPVFHLQGAEAYKPRLDNMRLLLDELGNPHQQLRVIHVAGTNGKGSTACLIAAALQNAGYRTGLYTSPHLVDFTERIRVNGKPISRERVAQFVEEHKDLLEIVKPSFFETATAMAFDYFARKRVHFAVVEVGLGGRLDATNVVSPLVSVITSIGLDHQEFLGNTLTDIAKEKAGIIKTAVPVVVGEQDPILLEVFSKCAEHVGAQMLSTTQLPEVVDDALKTWTIACQLGGEYQRQNIITALLALYVLADQYGLKCFSKENIETAFAHVCDLTGLQGRWQVVSTNPVLICDIGHNSHGLRHVFTQLQKTHLEKVREWMCKPFYGAEPKPQPRMRVMIGMMKDKDVQSVFDLLPRNSADYYLTQANTPRAMNVDELARFARERGLSATTYSSVSNALKSILADADENDVLLVTGSNYVVGEVLSWWHRYRRSDASRMPKVATTGANVPPSDESSSE